MLIKIHATDKDGRRRYFHGLAKGGCFEIHTLWDLEKLLYTIQKKNPGEKVDYDLAD